MSLLSPDHIRLGLGNSYAVLAKIKGNKLTHWRMQTWSLSGDVKTTNHGWQRGIEAVTSWLAEFNMRSSQVSVFLSAELGLLHLLPWRDDATSPAATGGFLGAFAKTLLVVAVILLVMAALIAAQPTD